MKKIVFTGGGTAGHVSPNIALIQKLKSLYSPEELEISYIGGKAGIEKEMLQPENIAYYGISCGKLRRYRSLKNLTDPFRVLAGFFQALRLLRRSRPDLLFSKGGFVAVPPVLAAFFCRIPIIIHESDYSPGLATKISAKVANRICLTFEDTLRCFPASKAVWTGTPIRRQLHAGRPAAGYALTGFTPEKPVVLVMGGSQGSRAINQALLAALPELTKELQIIHLAGKGNAAAMPQDLPGYVCYDFLAGELADVLAITDFVISRAGSNAIFEFLSLKKPMLLIPLPLSASRGDQLLNAEYFQKKGYALTLPQEELNPDSLISAVRKLQAQHADLTAAMQASPDGTDAVLAEIKKYL